MTERPRSKYEYTNIVFGRIEINFLTNLSSNIYSNLTPLENVFPFFNHT